MYYIGNGYGNYDCPKNVLRIMSLKEVKKIAFLENSLTKKTSTGASLFYDRYGSPGYPNNFLPIKPLKEVEQNK